MKRNLIILATFLATTTIYAQTVTTIAGKENVDGSNWSNTTAAPGDAYFWKPAGMAFDGSGNMYVVETNKVRLLHNGSYYNRAGKTGDPTFNAGYSDATGSQAAFRAPSDVICTNGDAYVVDSENHSIRKVAKFTATGNGQIVTTFVGEKPKNLINGQGASGYQDGSGFNARFDTPKGITMDAAGNFYVTDNLNFCIRKITPAGAVTTLSGNAGQDGEVDGTGSTSRFGGPWGIAMYDANHVVITDNWNTSVRKVNIISGKTTTICGKFGRAFHKDGTLAEAGFRSPKGIAVVNGLIYVADGTTIRVIDEANGTVSTFAGSGTAGGNQDGVGSDARFQSLSGLIYDGTNRLLVTDVHFNLIKQVTIDNLAPSANFSATKTSLQVDEETTLSDISGGKPATSRKWTVEDLNGSSAEVVLVSGDYNSSKDITVKFSETGFYNVKLDVTNEFGSDSESKNSYLNVSRTGNITYYDALAENVVIYPNPTSGESLNLSMTTGHFKDAQVQIFSSEGKLVYSKESVQGSNITFQNLNLESGVYILTINGKHVSGAKKFLVR
jgi:PKD repeat protein